MLTLFLAFPCFGEDSFFSNLEKKPKAVQKKLIENRLQFVMKKGVDLKTEDTVRVYLNLSQDKNKSIDFLTSILNQRGSFDIKRKILSGVMLYNDEEDLQTSGEDAKKQQAQDPASVKAKNQVPASIVLGKRKVLSVMIQSCRKSECIALIGDLPTIVQPGVLDIGLKKEIFGLLTYPNYSPKFAKSYFFTKLLDDLIASDKKSIKDIFSTTTGYGRYDYLRKIVNKYKKEFAKEEWFHFYRCLLFSVGEGKFKEAKACFSKFKTFKFKRNVVSIIFMERKKVDEKDLQELESLFMELPPERRSPTFPLQKALLSKKITKEVLSKLDLNQLSVDYSGGYFFFVINKRHGLLTGKPLEKLMTKYHQKFEGTILSQSLKGKVTQEQLVEYFGKYYHFVLLFLDNCQKTILHLIFKSAG